MEGLPTFRDGDILLTKDHFIFYVFGYDFPPKQVVAYLKYVPKELQSHFQLAWIPFEWSFNDIKFVRPKKLYSPKNFKEIQRVFEKEYSEYLFHDPYSGKMLFVVPTEAIQQVFVPEVQWQELLKKQNPTPLETEAKEIIEFLSQSAVVHLSDFGIHGSISTGMSTEESDVDIAIYGGQNYLKVKKAVYELFKEKKLDYCNETTSDEYRMNKCIYKGRKFVFNAIRKQQEIKTRYGQFKYTPVRPIHFHADVVESRERMFRPAIYNIEEYFPCDTESLLVQIYWPTQVVSMIGEFRDIARKGDEVEVQGMLEKVEGTQSREIFYRVVIGSGAGEEFIWPV
ncbi:MAG: hypothetical protein LUQ65_05565 [Candidatus Helarchaeota archaeon]|nr:hypothetical protein [Candidatus Helarchaeota archaeon]